MEAYTAGVMEDRIGLESGRNGSITGIKESSESLSSPSINNPLSLFGEIDSSSSDSVGGCVDDVESWRVFDTSVSVLIAALLGELSPFATLLDTA
jgi:hypothetical protein